MESNPPVEAHTSMPNTSMPNTSMPSDIPHTTMPSDVPHTTVIPPTSSASPRVMNANAAQKRGSVMQISRELSNAVIASMAAQCMPVILCASFALMVQASQNCGDANKIISGACEKLVDGLLAYAVAVGAISCLICLFYFAMSKFQPGVLSPYEIYIAFFLALWWTLGACLLTFDNPYTTVGNGYFASWVGALSSNTYLFMKSKSLREHSSNVQIASEQQPAFILFLLSMIEMIAAANKCANIDYCEKEYGWAVAVGCISALLCIIIMICAFTSPLPRVVMQILAIFFVVLWIPGVYVNTFIAPFQQVGNGYLSSWCALFIAVIFAENVFVKFPLGSNNPAAGTGGGGVQTAKPNEDIHGRAHAGRAESVETL